MKTTRLQRCQGKHGSAFTFAFYLLLLSSYSNAQDPIFSFSRTGEDPTKSSILKFNFSELEKQVSSSTSNQGLTFFRDKDDEGSAIAANLDAFNEMPVNTKKLRGNTLSIRGESADGNIVWLTYTPSQVAGAEKSIFGTFDVAGGPRLLLKRLPGSAGEYSLSVIEPEGEIEEDEFALSSVVGSKTTIMNARSSFQALTQSSRDDIKRLKPQINIAIFYTYAAKQEALESSEDIETIGHRCLEQLNFAFEQSEIHANANLVCLQEVRYQEQYDVIAETLNYLQDDKDIHLNSVHKARRESEADIVCLLAVTKGASGLANRMEKHLNSPKAFAANAFCVVHWEKSYSKFSFTHEIGHILGCCHGNDTHAQLFTFCSPHTYIAGGESNITVMGYGNRVTKRRLRFSNPNVLDRGVPTGTRNADHANCVDQTSTTASLFSRQ